MFSVTDYSQKSPSAQDFFDIDDAAEDTQVRVIEISLQLTMFPSALNSTAG